MFKLMGKKIITVLCSKNCFSGPETPLFISVLVTHTSEQLQILLKVGFSELEDYGCIQTGFSISHPEASYSENSVTLCIDRQKKL